MNVSDLIEDINTGCLVEVQAAACSYYDNARGLTVRQSYYVYPNGMIAQLNSCDGTSRVTVLDPENAGIFNARYNP